MTTKTKKDWAVAGEDEFYALTWLRQAPKETPLYGIVRSVSRSGMSRRIDFYAIDPKDQRPIWLTPVFRDVLGLSQGSGDRDGLRVDGCGMDMIFDCIYNMGRAIKGDGYYFRSEQL
jgi:hypothetical protein